MFAKVIYSGSLFPHLLSEKIAIADIKKPWGWQVGITARIRKMGFCNFRQIIWPLELHYCLQCRDCVCLTVLWWESVTYTESVWDVVSAQGTVLLSFLQVRCRWLPSKYPSAASGAHSSWGAKGMSGSSAAIKRLEIHSEGQHVLIHSRLCVRVPARGW